MLRLTLLALSLVPGLAHALSCIAPNPARDFNMDIDRGVVPTVILGELTPVAEVPLRTGTEATSARYRVTGSVLGAHGASPVEEGLEITAHAVCVIQWCAPLPQATGLGLMLLSPVTQPDEPELMLDPSRPALYEMPTPAQTDHLVACLRDGVCSEAAAAAFQPY